MHKWMWKLHTHTHTLLFHYATISWAWAHSYGLLPGTPTHPASPPKPRLECQIPTFSLFRPSIPPFLYSILHAFKDPSGQPRYITNTVIPQCEGKNTASPTRFSSFPCPLTESLSKVTIIHKEEKTARLPPDSLLPLWSYIKSLLSCLIHQPGAPLSSPAVLLGPHQHSWWRTRLVDKTTQTAVQTGLATVAAGFPSFHGGLGAHRLTGPLNNERNVWAAPALLHHHHYVSRLLF